MSRAKPLHYKLYVINTDEKLSGINSFLQERTNNKKEIGPMRKDFTRNIITGEYSESSRKLVILDKSFYQRLKNSGYGEQGSKSEEFEIIPYTIRNEDFAHKKSSVMHYYFPLETDQDNISCVRDKLDYFTKMGMINKEDWLIHDSGIVEFSENVTPTTRVIIKIIIDNPADCRVSWVRHEAWNRIVPHFKENI